MLFEMILLSLEFENMYEHQIQILENYIDYLHVKIILHAWI